MCYNKAKSSTVTNITSHDAQEKDKMVNQKAITDLPVEIEKI